ncbi:hypothetical protein [Larkinella soli]|uniref:hypothetical protein n=1 Tax=Larkinella soli TaxID=1770527 RepID=UPI000FFB15BF|nr:hypothetical protein [Larkinella soli]
MIVKRVVLPKLKYGQNTEYVRTQPGLTGFPDNRFIVITPREDIPNETYINKGIDGLILNGGVNPVDTPFANRSVCMGNGWIKDRAQSVLGGKHIGDFTETECRQAVQNYLNNGRSGGYKYLTGQMYEAYGGAEAWRLIAGSNQDRWIYSEIQNVIGAQGGLCFGDYDGHMLLMRFDDYSNPNMHRSSWGNPAQSLITAKSATPFNNCFFTSANPAWQYRHGLINTYNHWPLNPRNFVFSHIAGFHFDAQAKIAVGTNRKTCAFGWASEAQFTDYLQKFQYKLPLTGGYYESWHFANYSFALKVMIDFLSYLMLDGGVINWQSENRYGNNPEVIPSNGVQDGRQHRYYGSGNPVRGVNQSAYDPSKTYAFPVRPIGFEDAQWIAADWYAQAVAWAGQAYTHPRQTVGSSSIEVTPTYLLDAHLDGKWLSFMGGQGNRRWVFTLNLADQGTWSTPTFNLSGGSLTRELNHGTPYLFLIEL